MRRSNWGTLKIVLILTASLAGGASVALAQVTTNERLEELEREIVEGQEELEEQEAAVQRLNDEMDTMRHRSIEIVEEVQTLEARSLEMEASLSDLLGQESLLVTDLNERRVALVDILAALQSVERNKPPALLVRPDDAVEAARSAMLLGAILPELEEQAAGLRTQLLALGNLRSDIVIEQESHARTTQALELEEANLDDLLALRAGIAQELSAAVESQQGQLAAYASEAQDIRGLIDRLTRALTDAAPMMRPVPQTRTERRQPTLNASPALAPNIIDRFAQALGTLRMPAVGRVLRRFGDTLEPGTHSQGVALATRARARVVAPFDSEIVFAAPYRGYGQLLILSPGDGYLVLLSGLERIDGVVGQQLLTGEPIGIMGSEILAPNMRRWAVSEDAVHDGQPVLYLEMREDGEPIDPLPWFREDQWRSDGS